MLLSLPKVGFDLSLYLRLTNEHSVQKSVMSINTNTKEVEQVISMYLKMGLMQMSVVRMYWETDTWYTPVSDEMLCL